MELEEAEEGRAGEREKMAPMEGRVQNEISENLRNRGRGRACKSTSRRYGMEEGIERMNRERNLERDGAVTRERRAI